MTALVFIFAGLLSIVQFFSSDFSEQIEKHHKKITSLSAGIFIAYILLNLLPELVNSTQIIGQNAFILVLAGFLIFHTLEKYLYQHITNKKTLLKDLAELHAMGFFFDQFVSGMLLFFAITADDVLVGSIIFLPLLLHTLSSAIALQHIKEYFNSSKRVNIILSCAPLLGAIFIFTQSTLQNVHYSIFAFTIGMLLYIVIRDTIPNGKTGDTKFFILGAAVTTATIIIASTLSETGLFGL